MSKPLDECRATLARIDTKLQAFEGRVQEYHAESCCVTHDDDLQRGERLYRIAEIRQPPIELNIDVSEILGLMRSALDHLMFAIVRIAQGGAVPTDLEGKIQFPIVDIGKTFDENSPTNKKYGLSASQWAWIKSLQPGTRTNPRELPLVLLNALAKVSKHRFHNAIETLIPKTLADMPLIEGVGESVVQHCTIKNRFILVAHAVKADFKEGAIIYRFVPGKMDDRETALADFWRYSNAFPLNSWESSLSLAEQTIGVPWSIPEWIEYFRELQPNVEVSQDLLFGPGSGYADGLSVCNTLKTIQAYLHSDIFADQGAIKGL